MASSLPPVGAASAPPALPKQPSDADPEVTGSARAEGGETPWVGGVPKARPVIEPLARTLESLRVEIESLRVGKGPDPAARKARLERIISDSSKGAESDLPPNLKAKWLLRRSSAQFALYETGLGGKLDALASAKSMGIAVETAPTEPEVAMNFGRSMRGLSLLGGLERFGIGVLLARDLDEEMKRAVRLLEPVDDALAQLTRAELAKFQKMSGPEGDALARIAKMPAAQVEAAKRLLADDRAKTLAASAKNK